MQGVPRLGAHVDPMGGQVACRKRKVSWRRAPEDIAWALGIAPVDSVCTVRCHWSVNGEPAAISTTYVTGDAAAEIGDLADDRDRVVADLQLWAFPDGEAQGALRPALGIATALHVELQPPPSSVARGLRLGAGQPAAMVTVRFDDQSSGRPVALAVAALRADLFRIVVDSPAESSPVRGIATAAALDEGMGQAGDDDPWPADDHPAGRS
jgi:DNA-binding GntR family transcriptional regulator